MLRGEVVADAEVPRLTFDGPVERPEQTALAIRFEGDLEALKKAMSEGFQQLGKTIDENQLTTTGSPFAIYHKVDITKMYFICDIAWPVTKETTSSAFEIKTYPGGRYYQTTLQGSYDFMELAWYQAYAHLQMQKIRPQHKRASLEVYENDPGSVSHSNEIVTTIYIPIK
jgi:effector-binding domain-containing protein